MSFIETPRLPNNIAFGATIGPAYATDVAELRSGYEQRNIGWDQALIRFDLAMPLSATQLAELQAWFRSMKGQGHGFRVRDPSDYTTDVTTGRLGTSTNGTGVPAYQLTKQYGTGSLLEYRTIRKPVAAAPTPGIYRGGVLQTAGGGAGNYALDTTTGTVTFVADSSSSVTAVTVGATTQVTLTASLAGLVAGTGKLYLSGLGGTVGAALNGLAHTINTITGGGSNVYTLATSTTGLAYTSGGTGFKYAQTTETLHWIGQFDVPCRFADDFLGVQAVEGIQRWAGPITLREIRT